MPKFLANLEISEGINLSLGTTTGTKIGTSTTQKLGFYNVTPVVQQGATTDLKDALTSYGLITGASASPLDLDGGQLTTGTILANGASTISNNPPSAAQNLGWKMSLWNNFYAMGIAPSTLVMKTGTWFSVFTTNPAGAATSSVPDANASVTLGTGANTKAAIWWSTDTNLYRDSADNLKTDDNLTVAGNLTVTGTATYGATTVPKLILTHGTTTPNRGLGLTSYTSNGTPTGAIVIQTPYQFVNHLQSIKITGYRFDQSGPFEAIIGFYNYEVGPQFASYYHLTFIGVDPFPVTLARNDTSGCVAIILGTTATVWQYPQLSVDAMLGYSAVTTQLTGTWSTSITTSLTTPINYSLSTTPTLQYPVTRISSGTAGVDFGAKNVYGIGTLTASGVANVGSLVTSTSASVGTALSVGTSGSFGSTVQIITSTASTSSTGYDVLKRGTTGDANAAVTSGTELGYHGYFGWDGAAYTRGGFAIMHATAAWTSTVRGASYSIYTRPNTASAFEAVALYLSHDQRVGLGTTGNALPGKLNFAAATTNTEGIYFGTDTNLYRLTTDVLCTDDNLHMKVGFTTYSGDTGGAGNSIVQWKLGYGGSTDYAHYIRTRHNGGGVTLNAIDFFTGDGTQAGVFNNTTKNAVHGLTIENGKIGVGTNIVTALPNRISLPSGTTDADGIGFGTDTNLYRWSANNLRTDDYFYALGFGSIGTANGNTAYGSFISGDTSNRFNITVGGTMTWGSGAAAADTNLYRSAADTLRTDDAFDFATYLTVRGSTGNGMVRPAVGSTRVVGEISGANSTTLANDDGFLRLSAGGGTSGTTKSFIDISGYSTLTDMNNNIVLGTDGVERMRISSAGITFANGLPITSQGIRTIYESRTLPVSTTVNNCVAIGSFSVPFGATVLEINVVVDNTGFSVAKSYFIPIQWNLTNTVWTVANPLADTGAYSSQNFELNIHVSNDLSSLRLRRTAGTVAGTALVTIRQHGLTTSSVIYTSSSTITQDVTTLTSCPTTVLSSGPSSLGFFGVTPATRATATADIKDALASYGLLTNSGASPLNLDGGAFTTTGAVSIGATTHTSTTSFQGRVTNTSASMGNSVKHSFVLMKDLTDVSISGFYDRNELTYAHKRGTVTAAITTGPGTIAGSDNLFIPDAPGYCTVTGGDNTTVFTITVDMGSTQNAYSDSAFTPFVHQRTFGVYVHFSTISVEISLDATTWSTHSTWTSQAANGTGSMNNSIDGFWQGARQYATPNSQYRYVRFSLTGWTVITSGWTIAYIQQIGLRHMLAPMARQFLEVGGGTVWGNLGLGFASPTYKLQFASATTTTGGINFGADATAANLYRSTTSTLRTDGNFISNGTLTVNNTSTFGGNVAIGSSFLYFAAQGGSPYLYGSAGTLYVTGSSGSSSFSPTGGFSTGAITATSITDAISTQKVIASVGKTAAGTAITAGNSATAQKEINFIAGTNVTLTLNDNTAANRVDLTITAAGGGGGTPGGSSTHVQYNQSSAFAGEAAFAYDQAIDTLYIPNVVAATSNGSTALTLTGQASNVASGTAGAVTVTGGSSSGTTSVGGSVNIKGGTGTTTNGSVNIQNSAGTAQIQVNSTGIGFFNVTPVARAATSADLKDLLVAYGLMQNGAATNFDSDGGILYGVTLTPTSSVDTTTALAITGSPRTTASAIGGAVSVTGGAHSSGASGVGGAVNITGGSASGTTSTGGAVIIRGGTGTSAGGAVTIQTSTASTLFTGTIVSSNPALSFFGVSAVARAATTDDIKDALVAYGLLQNGGATPLDLDLGALSAGLGTHGVNNIATTPTDGLVIINNTASTVGTTVQMSPRSKWRGSAWKSDATAASQTHDYSLDVLPVTGAAESTSAFRVGYAFNGGAYSYPISLANTGTTTFLRNGTGNIYQSIFENTTAAAGNTAGFALKCGSWEIRFRTNNTNGWFEITDNADAVYHRWNANDYMLASGGKLLFSSETNFATGGVTTGDTNLYRGAANILKTDDLIACNGSTTITSNPPTSVSTLVGWKIGLYDSAYALGIASATLAIRTGGWVSVFTSNPANDGGTSPDTNAGISFGVNSASKYALVFSTDTNLYRDAAGVLKTDHQLQVTKRLTGGILATTNTTLDAAIATDSTQCNQHNINSTVNFSISVPSNGIDGHQVRFRIRNTHASAAVVATINASFTRYNNIAATINIPFAKSAYLGAIYNAADTRWDVVSYSAQN